MQVVIDIDDNLYTRLFDNGVDNYDDAENMATAIRKGIPLAKKGHWIGRDACGTRFYGKCSCCGQEIQIDAWYTENMNYCPNCGLRMTDPQENENKGDD